MNEPIFLSLEETMLIHASMIESYGGSYGVRDQGLLDSAVETPRSGFGGEYFHKSIFEMAAAYIFHIVKNHPFIDGNKRTGLGCTDVFLLINGYDLNFSIDIAEELTLRIASEPITKVEIAKILEEHSVKL